MQKVVGSIAVDLALNTASFSKDLGKMNTLAAKSANDIKKSLLTISGAFVGIAASVATATATIVGKTIESASAMAHMAQAAGTTTESLSAIAYAAKLVGTPVDEVGKGMTRLSKAAFGAQNGNAQLASVFQRLGISVTDSNGHLKDSGVLFGEVATKLSGFKDGAGKTAIAMQLFDKAGATLIPTLDEWGAKQVELTAQAKSFGLILGGDVAENAKKVHEGFEQLTEAGSGFALQLTAAALPAVEALIEQLQQIAKQADIPALAKTFGASLSSAITSTGNALAFAVKHASELKTIFEGMVAIKIATWLIPIASDLAAGGLLNLAAGAGKAASSLTGLNRTVTVLSTVIPALTAELGYQATFMGMLAAEEGIATAATYAATTAWEGFTAALIANPIGASVAVLTAVGVALYHVAEGALQSEVDGGRWADIWHAAILGLNEDVRAFTAVWDKLRGAMTQEDKDTLAHPFSSFEQLVKQAGDNRRAAADMLAKSQAPAAPKPTKLLDLNTSGLGKDKSQPYQEAVAKLKEQIAAEKSLQAVQGQSIEVIQRVEAANKANAAILEINNKLKSQSKALTTGEKDALTALYQSLGASSALTAYGDELAKQNQATKLAIAQTSALALANLSNDQAVRDASINNEILALTYNKTAAEIKALTPQLNALRSLLTNKQDEGVIEASTARIKSTQDETAATRLLIPAILAGEAAYRNASTAAEFYALNQKIAAATSADVRATLESEKAALIDLAAARHLEADTQAALSLLSPAEKYQRESESLAITTAALMKAQGGQLSYGQQLTIATKQQEMFNQAIRGTADQLLQTDSAANGMRAFFLEMQTDSVKTAAVFADAMRQAVDGVSAQLTKLFTGQKTSFGQMLSGIGDGMLQSGIKKALEGGLSKLGGMFGITGKADGSKSNPFFVQMASGIPGLGGLGGSTGSDGSVAGGIFSKVGGLLTGLIPHADGGSVSPGNAYLVGERGPELRTFDSPGYIHSNAATKSMMSGSGPSGLQQHFHIDAKGSTDPAQTEAAVHRAMSAWAPQLVQASVQANRQMAYRTPATAR